MSDLPDFDVIYAAVTAKHGREPQVSIGMRIACEVCKTIAVAERHHTDCPGCADRGHWYRMKTAAQYRWWANVWKQMSYATRARLAVALAVRLEAT